MSLILDALRKSEAERRRGQAPSLYSQAPVPGAALRPAWLPWLPVAGIVLLLVAVAVWFMRDDAPATKDELVDQGPSLVSKAPASDAGVVPTGADTSAPAPPPLAPAPTESAGPKPSPPGVDALVKPPANPAVAAVNAATSTSPQASVSPPDAGAADNDAANNDAANNDAAPAEEPVPSVAVLDPSTRSALPPMKLSMHVYDPDPSRRFAIIDGQRVTEGSQLGSAIVLSIRRDGVLLDVSGRRVLLPRP